jgi:hypothetical protein
MQMSKTATVLSILASLLVAPQIGRAQLGFYTLPKDDFVWRWGDRREREGEQHGFPDIEARGSESSFQCELTARLRVSSRLSQTELNQLQNELSTRMDFIYAVSETMNRLDYALALDWATLDCKKHEPPPRDEAERATREAEAREKMQREIERRRARQQNDQ